MYEYFGVGPEIWEEVASIFPRFLYWLPKHHLSIPFRCSLEIWHLVMTWSFLIPSSFVTFLMNLNPWAGCEGYVECEPALELNGQQILFECGHGKYCYLGDWVLPQVEHVYPPTTILTPSCHTIWLADFLANEEIARARDGYIVTEAEGNYSKFVRDHLQGCLVGRTVFIFSSKIKFLDLVNSFSYFCLVTILARWIFNLQLLKERKGERKRKRFLLLTMLVAVLVLSWRLIPIFRHGSMM